MSDRQNDQQITESNSMTYGQLLKEPELEVEYFKVPAISNSIMSSLNPAQGGSPRRFQYAMKGSFEKKDSLSLERGSLLHLAMLEPELFVTQDVDKPSGLMGTFIEAYYFVVREWEIEKHGSYTGLRYPDPMANETLMDLAMMTSGYKLSPERVWDMFQKPENQSYYNYLRSATGKISMTKETRTIVTNCITALNAHPLANQLLNVEDDEVSSWNEQEVYWTEKTFIDGKWIEIPCKAKIDRLRYHERQNRAQQIDLKTTGKSLQHFVKSFEQFSYFRQNAFYQKATLEFLKQQGVKLSLGDISSLNVVVETNPLHEVGVVKTTPAWLEKGRAEIADVLGRYAWHTRHEKWDYPREYYQSGGLLPLPDPT